MKIIGRSEYASNTGDIYGIPVTELMGTDTVTMKHGMKWMRKDTPINP
ncbi:MAG: hypothetical protein R3C44_20515 [Chloroflexota bacterium]